MTVVTPACKTAILSRRHQHHLIVTYLRQCFDLMQNHGFVAKLDQRLGPTKCKWPETSAIPADKDEGLHAAGFRWTVMCESREEEGMERRGSHTQH